MNAADIYVELDRRAPALSRATRRQYRAAVAFGLETGAIEAGAGDTRPSPTVLGRARGEHTASLKMKRLDDRDLRRIDAELRRSSSGYARHLRGFLLANRIIGARVCEWRYAVYLPTHPATGAPALVLRNGKATNGRANGDQRTLHLGSLSAEARAVVAACAGWLAARGHAGTFDAWQTGAAKLLQRICRRLWPRRRRQVTLYSTRHHAAARCKALYGKLEVAALMGHASVTTAGLHYARTARGARAPKPGSIPAPDPTCVRRLAAARQHHARRRAHANPPTRKRSSAPGAGGPP